MRTYQVFGILAVGAAMAAAVSAAEGTVIGPITFAVATEYTSNFRDFSNGASINWGTDLGGTGHNALNFTADNTLTVYDTTPADGTVKNLFTGNLTVTADVLVDTFNNGKVPGLLALFNEGTGQKGIAFAFNDAGGTDRLKIYTVDQTGNFVTDLASVTPSSITEDVWYRMHLGVTVIGDSFTVTGTLYDHSTTSDPNSSTTLHGGTSTVAYTGSLSALGLNTAGTGEAGMVYNRTGGTGSYTNYTITPEPATMILMGVGGLAVGASRIRGRKRRTA